MIAKKNSRFDLEQRRIVLFQIGLLTAASFTMAAFTYKNDFIREHEEMMEDYVPITYIQEEKEQPEEQPEEVVRQTPPSDNNQQNQSTSSASASVSENTQTTSNTETMVGPGLDLPDVGPVDNGIIDIDPGTIEEFPPVPAEYIGGYVAMQEYIIDELEYPEIDIVGRVQGRVYLVFVIERDGSVSNVDVERGVSETIDREAKRIVRSFPKWKPAENAYGTVRTRVRLPINFTFGD